MTLAIFSREPTAHRLDWLLREFHHVHAALRTESGDWVHVEAVDGAQMFRVVPGSVDLAKWFTDLGNVVIEIEATGYAARTPVIANSCVGLVKAALGVRAWWVQTPDQLYRHLKRGTP